jgi:hypothetical protein
MKSILERSLLPALILCLAFPASAQTNLPGMTVTAPYTEQHGGYVVSGDFKVDPRMPTVVFPAEALVQDDILSIKPLNLADDEYLVLQECASADCSQARIVRIWNASGETSSVQSNAGRIWIKHENKYFIWLKRIPQGLVNTRCVGCPSHFTSFAQVSPPLTIVPNGELAAQGGAALVAAQNADPIPVETQTHEGATFVVTFAGGSVVRIRRMHAAP